MGEQPKQHHGGDELKDLSSSDANAILTEAPAEGAGPGRDEGGLIGREASGEASPGGRRNVGAAGDDLPQNDMRSVGSSPSGEPEGSAQEGSSGASTYNDRGRVVGPDSPGGDISREASGGQGDDLANRLGGGEGGGAGLNANGASGDMSATSADPTDEDDLLRAGSAGPDAGSPGGMGGVRSRPDASGRPPGGVSPVQPSRGQDS
jgi:hypothetical protein